MPSESVLVDTGFFAAIFNPGDQYHAACVAQTQRLPVGKAYTCWPVVTETVYLLRRYPAKRDEFLGAIANQEFTLLPLASDDVESIQDVFEKYHDQDVDLADATLVHLADRETIRTVFTTDRRHFSVFRLRNGKQFHLLP
jgi:predicted nucleic acid-binding protein